MRLDPEELFVARLDVFRCPGCDRAVLPTREIDRGDKVTREYECVCGVRYGPVETFYRRGKGQTSNVQRSTLNVQGKKGGVAA